ncbi:hypothetical protein SmJEL517_g05541 [Synchytrium microbalum]|uniref:RIC1 C-terminal alpha solenoid region domain-containing protein n=1 Tax=Synchytrium microbalum TaxID=1806994 RepID=A0A507BVT0_9FUNG|nr:uncharacterized protein SmJEL517_g05541 [Synchytrium microbalum]TPX31029.1 hypothetical protein SmJEL517_g05541 [Synchytrium microbalum]
MFFVSGSAKVLSGPVDGSTIGSSVDSLSVLALRKCPGHELFATITANTIQLWSSRPNVVLSQVQRGEATLNEDGENSDIMWKPDATGLVVLTTSGFLHFYDVVEGSDTMLDYDFASSHHYMTGPGEGHKLDDLSLRFRMALEIDTSVQCGVGLQNDLLVCTRDSPSLLSLTWNGEVKLEASVVLANLDFQGQAQEVVIQIVLYPGRDMFGWITGKGRAFVAQRILVPTDAETSSYSWTGVCIYNQDSAASSATCISFNARFSLVAVGAADGTIYVYSITEDRQSLRTSHRLELPKTVSSYLHHTVGPVTSMDWSEDGYALAAGWKFGGMAIWSVFGRLLMSTISEDTSIQTPANGSAGQLEDYFHGVQDLFWGTGDFDLYVLPGPGLMSGSRNDIYVIPLLKTPLTTNSNPDNSRNVFLIGEDRLLLYEGNNSEFNVTDLDLIQWDTVQAPQSYITSNWPIRFAAINSTGHYIAVAGTFGLAHYDKASSRWKLFGNEQQEQSFSIRGGMVWFKSLLIAACVNNDSGDHELRLFSRDANLDTSQALLSHHLISEAITLSSLDSHILIYSADSVLRHYSIVTGSVGRPSFHLHQQINFVDIISNPWSVQSVAWIPPFREATLETIKTSPILILKSGELSVLKESPKHDWEHMVLANHIEHFFVSKPLERAAGMHHSLWAFDGAGVKIWANIITDDTMLPEAWPPTKNWNEDIRMELDFYPLTVMMHRAIIMGIEQRMALRNSVQCTFYKLETKTHLYLHHIIRYVLSRGMEEEAVAFAAGFRHLQYFGHSLEMLLHQVLEEEAETFAGFSQGALLPCIARFLEAFPHHLDVIVRCARKTEVALWEYFFSIVGDAKELFSQCLQSGALDTATSYLIIIQTLEPAAVSGKLAIQLLEKAFEMEDFETGKELVRFLSSIDGMPRSADEKHHISPSTTNGVTSKGDSLAEDHKHLEAQISMSMHDGTDLFYIEILISKHARKLMAKQRVRALGRFASQLSFPLIKWLKRERNRSAMFDDWHGALMSLHEQFERPLPTEAAILAGDRTTSSPTRKGSFTPFAETTSASSVSSLFDDNSPNGPASAHPSTSPSSVKAPRKRANTLPSSQVSDLVTDPNTHTDEDEELQAMIRTTREAECWEWCIILASFAMDVGTLLEALSEEDGPAAGLRNKWRGALMNTNRYLSGY